MGNSCMSGGCTDQCQVCGDKTYEFLLGDYYLEPY